MRDNDGSTRHTWYMAPLPFDEGTGDILAAFRLHGLASGHSDRTIDAREATIHRLGATLDILTADEDALVQWLAGLDLARSSRATYRSHLCAFFKWLRKSGRREDDPSLDLPSARPPRGVPHPVSTSGVVAVLAACADKRARTTRAMVILAAFEGLRVHEIAKVRGEDFMDGLVLVTGKGGVQSTIPLHPMVLELVETMPRTGWWFPSNSDTGHVSRVSVSLAIGRAM